MWFKGTDYNLEWMASIGKHEFVTWELLHGNKNSEAELEKFFDIAIKPDEIPFTEVKKEEASIPIIHKADSNYKGNIIDIPGIAHELKKSSDALGDLQIKLMT